VPFTAFSQSVVSPHRQASPSPPRLPARLAAPPRVVVPAAQAPESALSRPISTMSPLQVLISRRTERDILVAADGYCGARVVACAPPGNVSQAPAQVAACRDEEGIPSLEQACCQQRSLSAPSLEGKPPQLRVVLPEAGFTAGGIPVHVSPLPATPMGSAADAHVADGAASVTATCDAAVDSDEEDELTFEQYQNRVRQQAQAQASLPTGLQVKSTGLAGVLSPMSPVTMTHAATDPPNGAAVRVSSVPVSWSRRASADARKQLERREAMRKAVLEHLAREGQPNEDINTSDDEILCSAEEEDDNVPSPKGVTVRMKSGVQVQPGDMLIFTSRKALGDLAKLRLMNDSFSAIALSISTSEARAYTAYPCRLTLNPGECQTVEVRSNGLRRIAKRPPLLIRALSIATWRRAEEIPWSDLQGSGVDELQLSTVREEDVKDQLRQQRRGGRRVLGTDLDNAPPPSANVMATRNEEEEDDEEISFEEYRRHCLIQQQGMVAVT